MGLDKYIYGVQCGDKDCYACGTQRYNCSKLNKLDNEVDLEADTRNVSLETVLQDMPGFEGTWKELDNLI